MSRELMDNLYKFLSDLSKREEELDFTIINYFAREIENRGIKPSEIKRESLRDDVKALSDGDYMLTVIYYEDKDEVDIILPKNYADASAIEQLLIRMKYFKLKSEKKVKGYLLALAIPEKYVRIARNEGIEVIVDQILK
ncbi:MAG: hypothetical protein OWQ54_09095 [Sulfolobaceae archaeon]|nr:hypothetical protein [Sulfolobaceae archaeon]